MTVTTTGNRAEFAGNGVTTAFSYPNKFLLNADLTVLLVDEDGVEDLQVLNSDYTVAGAGDANGGTVTMSVAPPTGSNLVVYGNPTFNQPYDIGENEIIPAETTETAWDRVVIFCQSLKNALSRTIRLADGETATFDPKLPPIVANTLIGINEDGDGIALTDATTFKGETGDTGPQGPQGDPGDAATIEVGTVTTVAPEDPATVTNVGTSSAAVFDFEIPKGDPGESTSLITTSDEAPDDGVGANGDVWLLLDDGNPANGNVYQKAAGTYDLRGSIQGPAGGVNSYNGRTGAVVPVAGDYTASDVGLGNVDNTADADKPVSTAQQTALDGKEDSLGVGTEGQVLTTVSGVKTWADPSAGGSPSIEWFEDDSSPISFIENGVRGYSFEDGMGQKLRGLLRVPASYSAGKQIKLKVPGYSSASSDTLLLQTVSTLIRPGTDAMSSTTNQRTSTNTAQTPAGASITVDFEMDLTSSSGQINSVAVAAGHLIPFELKRGTDSQTVDLKALVYAYEVIYV